MIGIFTGYTGINNQLNMTGCGIWKPGKEALHGNSDVEDERTSARKPRDGTGAPFWRKSDVRGVQLTIYEEKVPFFWRIGTTACEGKIEKHYKNDGSCWLILFMASGVTHSPACWCLSRKVHAFKLCGETMRKPPGDVFSSLKEV